MHPSPDNTLIYINLVLLFLLMQDRVTICNDADRTKYTRLALFFITIPAKCHLDQLFVCSESR